MRPIINNNGQKLFNIIKLPNKVIWSRGELTYKYAQQIYKKNKFLGKKIIENLF